MVLTNESVEERLEIAHTKILGAKDSKKIGPLLVPMGFDETRWSEGVKLYDTAVEWNITQKQIYTQQFLATEMLHEEWERLDKIYMKHVMIGQVALDGHASYLKGTALLGRRLNSLTGWLSQNRMLYTFSLANPPVSTLLGTYGLLEEELTAALQAVEKLAAMRVAQGVEAGGAQNATEKRDLALDALENWVAKLVIIAKVVLVDSPQLLEQMGVKVAS
ncbi:MAG: hypothetical protein GY940_40635 [bacterium]|nr:hypothetical protein [bacterium]